MSILPSKVFVGLDYHQHTVQVCVLDESGNQLANATRPNTWQAVSEVVPQGAVVQAAIESCCGAANLADELIEHIRGFHTTRNQPTWALAYHRRQLG